MFDDSNAFFSRPFLQSELSLEYRGYAQTKDADVLLRLREWDRRRRLNERQAEGSFIQAFFVDLWGYNDAGRAGQDELTLIPQFPIRGEGAGGGVGAADLALGWFRDEDDPTPQVLCEFKDIRSRLDARQHRKGSDRSPVQQCLDYLKGARRGRFGNEPVEPRWGLVTDMNEFRLYWWDRAPKEYLRFTIRGTPDLFAKHDLLSDSEDARFDRFLFWKLFQRDTLLSQAGPPPLLRLIRRQWVREEELEGEFYERYRAVRERLFNVIRPNFQGTPTELLRLTQKLLDRFIFAFYCEDMGERMLFPPQLIKDFLKARSTEHFYDPSGHELWQTLKGLFREMDRGGKFGQLKVPHINGGLFEADPRIEALALPNDVFAAAGQGRTPADLERDPNTLLYLCGRYNYAARGDVRESLSLYTLGRIFEQSITELEYRAGELEGRETVAKLSKRKRDGVYYTPEWVVNLLVEQTLTPWFEAAKAACGYRVIDGAAESAEAAGAYLARLRAMRIVDPACGSGAFLISAFRRLLQERLALERERRGGNGGMTGEVGETQIIADILASNIYGVDINPASVEIAKLALWLHSARADTPLSSLDHTIRCGNSLVGMDYAVRPDDTGDVLERVNRFDWKAAFPEVWAEGRGGFDIVLGNPPYVKLQNLMKVDPHVAAYLQARRGDDTYLSAQTGNTDLYLPFIEKGLRLLNPEGRMAYIAPSLWTVNEYGEGLRQLVRAGRHLEHWIDFKAFQVFDEAITYTALQFFTGGVQTHMLIATAPGGESDANDVDWSDPQLPVPYDALPEQGPWLMITGQERALVERLARDCKRLDDSTLTTAIFQGLVTSADPIYHFAKISRNRFKTIEDDSAVEVEIEDELMKPLISGPQARRYEQPETNRYLLFPYDPMRSELRSQDEMRELFPNGWAYLKDHERDLRRRENSKMDRDADWWGYVYPKNLNKHERPKLIVAQTVPELRVCVDTENYYLNNVRVNGILPAEGVDPFFLLGTLNGPVADFVFRRIAKVKQGGWFEANKQFIAPLPIPDVSRGDQAEVAALARALQTGGTRRRDLMREAERRLGVLARARHKAKWLWPDLPSLPDMTAQAPAALRQKSERRSWADARLDEREAERLAALQATLDGGAILDARFENGELRLLAGGTAVLDQIFLDEAEGRVTEAYWRYLLLTRTQGDAESFANALRKPPSEFAVPAAQQFVERVAALAAETRAIAERESDLNELLYGLYGLNAAERLLVEGARGVRATPANQA
ncbi:MAG: Eco57I restriction-modification methylase domain-containing protein [Alphaproteobacteria bacterium]|nr:Eco57I restriction-modification methylase domain-containing protein [Alphaproteobacteria bacterium]